MSDHDIQLLALGTALGMYLMLLLQMGMEIRSGRRNRAANSEARAALKRSAGDRYLSSLRLYQVQHRSQA